MAALILFGLWPGMLTHESRGRPRIVALCLAGFSASRWIESAREWSTFSPGRAPLPISRMKTGLVPFRVGT
jgi:hypothetical protein